MEELQESNRPEPVRSRPVFLSVLCIMTFIGSGFIFFSFLFVWAFYRLILEMADLPQFQMPGIEIFKNSPRWVFFAGAVFYGASFIGAILIWHLKKAGFHVYTLAQIALLFLTSLFMYPGGLPSGELLFSLFFVLLYAMHLRFMK
ncbi:MAG: hypothetical protein NTU44_19370 [Bacteroidetes bacterium]|nr:hypothetical protein [Bacteroidota bacterium]